MDIAIIGAGMAGLSCADSLTLAGHRVSLFDKGRGPGGRMSARRMDIDGATVTFDHGAQYFTARDPAFLAQIEKWESEGIVARWPATDEDAWVGHPAMNVPIRHMAEQLDVTFGAKVEALEVDHDGWILSVDGELTERKFDAVIVAVPAEQATELLAPQHSVFASTARNTPSDPCWTLMLAFDQALVGVPDTIRPDGPIGWAARNSAKPGRGGKECWVIQAGPDWSAAHIENDAAVVEATLTRAVADLIDSPLPEPIMSQAHRWRYSRSGSAGESCLWDETSRLGVCGDWLIAPRVEAAFLSGRALADAIGAAE